LRSIALELTAKQKADAFDEFDLLKIVQAADEFGLLGCEAAAAVASRKNRKQTPHSSGSIGGYTRQD